MKLWFIAQNRNNGYDTYDSAVVAAETEAEARLIHPSCHNDDWDGKERDRYGCWVDADLVEVEYIGEAKVGIKPSVICASFNAG